METHYKILTNSNLVDLENLITVFNQTFDPADQKNIDSAQLQNLLHDKYFLAIVCFIEEKVIGGLTAFKIPKYSQPDPMLYIYDIAIEPRYQNAGIGKKMISFLIQYCKANSISEVFVQAHKEDTQAIKFYRSTFPDFEDETIHFTYEIK